MSSNFDWSQFQEVPQEQSFDFSKYQEAPPEKTFRDKPYLVRGKQSIKQNISDLWTGAQKEAQSMTGGLGTPSQLVQQLEQRSGENPERTRAREAGETTGGFLTSLLMPLGEGKAASKLAPLMGLPEDALKTVGKGLGLSEKELGYATSSEGRQRFLGNLAKETKGTRETAKSIEKKLTDAKEDILSKTFEGYEEGGKSGIKAVYENAYDEAKGAARFFDKPVKTQALQNHTSAFIRDLERTVKPSTEKQKAIDYLKDSVGLLKNKSHNLEELMNWFTDINEEVNWKAIGVKGKKRIAILKKPIIDAMKSQGWEGNEIAKLFEKGNAQYIKGIDYEDVSNILKKAFNEEKADFKKLHQLMVDKDNAVQMREILGNNQFGILKDIAKLGSNTEEITKILKGGELKKWLHAGKWLQAIPWIFAGNFVPLKAALLGEGTARLATKMMVDPKYQNLWKKALQALKSGNTKEVAKISIRMKRLIEKDFDVNLDE